MPIFEWFLESENRQLKRQLGGLIIETAQESGFNILDDSPE
jgi:hypothetical protein